MTGMDTAVIALLSTLLGIVLSNGFVRVLEIRRRRDRMLDMLTALHAEITAGSRASSLQTTNSEALYVTADDIPFGPADETDFVFEAVKSDLALLPIDVIYEIVLYYKLAAQSNLYTDDLKHPLFLQQAKAERQKYVENLLSLLAEQQMAARAAIDAIEIFTATHSLNLAARRHRAESLPLRDTDQRANGTNHEPPPSS